MDGLSFEGRQLLLAASQEFLVFGAILLEAIQFRLGKFRMFSGRRFCRRERFANVGYRSFQSCDFGTAG